jgi:uncharacterized protein YkwD
MRLRRSAKTLLATAASLLTLVTVPGTARSESSLACYNAITTVRARAGLPGASRSLVLERAALSHARYRARWDAAGLAENPHSESSGHAGFTGRLPWDRTKRAGLRDGTWAKQGENVVAGSGGSSQLVGVRAWLAAPYHRFPMLDANMRSVGCGASSGPVAPTRGAEVLEMVWPWGANRRVLTAWPLPHATGVARSFDRRSESPSPFASARTQVVGTVVSLQASGYHALRLTSRPTLAHGAHAVGIYWSNLGTDRNLPTNAVMLAAAGALGARTAYTVRMQGQVQSRPGGAWLPFARTWSFTTA